MSPDTAPGQTIPPSNSELPVPQAGTCDWFKEKINERIPNKKEFAASVVGLGLTAFAVFHPIIAHAEIISDTSGAPTEPEQLLGPKTPTPTNTPRPLRPTFTPTSRPTPETTPTPTPIEVEIPIFGTDIGKPSENAQAFILNADTRFRTVPNTQGNEPIVQKQNGTYIETGHTRQMSDGTWKEVFVGDQILFVRTDVVNSKLTTLSALDRLKYARFADTPPITTTLTPLDDLTKGALAQGGESEEVGAANILINNFWGGEDVASTAQTAPYNGLRQTLAMAALSPMGFAETGGIATYSYIDHEGNPVVIGPNINNGGFIKLTTNKDEFKNTQADSISLQDWNALVAELGLQQAREVAKQMNGINFRIFETIVNGKKVISSPDGYQAVDFYLQLTSEKNFDDGKPEPVVAPTSTPIPTVAIPTRTPVAPPTPVPSPATAVPPAQPVESQPVPGEGGGRCKISLYPKEM